MSLQSLQSHHESLHHAESHMWFAFSFKSLLSAGTAAVGGSVYIDIIWTYTYCLVMKHLAFCFSWVKHRKYSTVDVDKVASAGVM